MTKLLIPALALAIAGCATPGPSPTPPTVTARTKVPTVTALPETLGAQDKGGVQISVAAAAYKAEKKATIKRTSVRPNFGEGLIGPPKEERHLYAFVEETHTEEFKTSPDRLAFTVKINNKLSRVFRAAGTVVQFNVGGGYVGGNFTGGQLMAVDQTGYSELTGAIVPPRSELQLTVYGPPLDKISDKTTIGLFFYDVVTATDAAGNVTEKQNYAWYFDYATQTFEESVPLSTKRGWLRLTQ